MDPAVYEVSKMLQRQYRIQKATSNYAKLAPFLSNQVLDGIYGPAEGTRGAAITSRDYLSGRAALGKGAYRLGNLVRSAGGSIAHAMGADRQSGRKIAGLGLRTGNRLASMAGYGGYYPVGAGEYSGPGGNVNSLISGSDVSVPRMQGGDEIGSVVISHREYLGNITGSQLFENSPFQLNPGLVQTFPWLSQIAVNYEEYSFEQLMFTYTSLLSEATASGAVGSIIMTTNYNAGNPPFLGSTDMLNNIGTVSARPTDNPIIHGIECDDSKNVLPSYYVRVGAVPAAQDIKTYDVGLFQIATEGMPANDQLQGQLWVSYQIVLRKPKLFTAAGKGILMDVFKANSGITSAKMTGTPIAYSPFNTIGCTLSNPANNRFRVTFPSNVVQGVFKIVFQYDVPIVGGVYPPTPQMSPTPILSNCQFASATERAEYFGNALDAAAQATYGGVGSLYHKEVHLQLLGNYAIPTYIEYNFASLGVFTASYFSCQIIQINPRMTSTTSLSLPPEWITIAL